MLPVYTSTQNLGCPVDTWQISSSGTSVAAPPGLLLVGSTIVKPTVTATHTVYTFYTKVTASDGGATLYFGPYTLHVGCTAATVTFGDSSSIDTVPFTPVGQSLLSAYLFSLPTATRTWCIVTQNDILNPDGSAWTGAAKLTMSTLTSLN